MPSSSPSGPPSPSPTIRPWRHTDSPLLWSNAIVGSLILHLLILVPIARIWVNEPTESATEDLIPVDVIAATDSPPEPLPIPNEVPQQLPSQSVAKNPIPASTTSPKSTESSVTNTPLPTPPTPFSPVPEPTPTPSSPVPEPTPTPSSPVPEPTPEPTTQPGSAESDSPSKNPPFPADDTSSPPAEESSDNVDRDTADSSQDPPPAAEESESSETEGGGNSQGETGGLVVYRRSVFPDTRDIPDNPAQPQITPGQEFSITDILATQNCSNTSLIVRVRVNSDGNATILQVNGQAFALNDPCSQIVNSVVNPWIFRPAESGGFPVDSFLDIYLDL